MPLSCVLCCVRGEEDGRLHRFTAVDFVLENETRDVQRPKGRMNELAGKVVL